MWGIWDVIAKLQLPPPPSLMTNVLPVQKHMLLLKKRCRNSLLLSSCLWSLRGEEQAQKYYLFFLGEFLTALLYCMLSSKRVRKPKLALLWLGYLMCALCESLWGSGRVTRHMGYWGHAKAKTKQKRARETVFIWILPNLQCKFRTRILPKHLASLLRFLYQLISSISFFSVCV